MSFSLSEYIKNNVGWGFKPDCTGEITVVSQTSTWFHRRRFVAVWDGGEQTRKDWGRISEGRNGIKGEGLQGWGDRGGVVPWLLGGIDAPGTLTE